MDDLEAVNRRDLDFLQLLWPLLFKQCYLGTSTAPPSKLRNRLAQKERRGMVEVFLASVRRILRAALPVRCTG